MRTLIFWILSAFVLFGQNSGNDTLFIAAWNVENLFDTDDDPEKKDEDFTPEGFKEWTNERLSTKLENLKKVIESMNNGAGPDILGMEEVENQSIADSLVSSLNEKYKLVYSESPDGRGIDNCLVFNTEKLTFVSLEAVPVHLSDNWPTRDLIITELLTTTGDTLSVIVNHWPSRSGGQEKSEPNRIAAATSLKNYLVEKNFCTSSKYFVMMGDFNDEPDNISITDHLGVTGYEENTTVSDSGLYNLAAKLDSDSLGTYLYRGTWNMLDQMIVSGNVIKDDSFVYVKNSFTIYKPEFMVTKDGYYKGSAIPTYGGKKYLGGYSDHFPVYAKFVIKGN